MAAIFQRKPVIRFKTINQLIFENRQLPHPFRHTKKKKKYYSLLIIELNY